MNAKTEENLLTKLKALTPQQVAEVEDFVEFLTAKARKRSAIERLLAIAPALQTAGVAAVSEDEIAVEVKAARQQRRARSQQAAPDLSADRT